MKTKEELKALKQEYESLKRKLEELSEDELKEVTGGTDFIIPEKPNDYNYHIYTGSVTDTNKDNR